MKIFQTRLFLLSIVVGLFAGIFGSAFRWCLNQSLIVRELMFRHDQTFLYHAAVFAGMWLLAMGIYWLTKHVRMIAGSGIPQSRGAILGRYSFKKPWIQFISKFFGSLGAIGMGLSLGREGPSVQIGAFGATLINKYIKTTPTEKRYLLAAGAGAGLSAAFTAPIASTIFLIEDTLGWVSLRIGLPALLACITAGYCAQILLPDNVYLTVPTIFPDIHFGVLFLILVGFGILGALGGKLFNLTLFNFKKWYSEAKIPAGIKLLGVIGLTYIAGMLILDLTSGGETELIKQTLSSGGNLWWLFAMVIIKIAFTAICYSTGLCGSLLLPLIVMGGLMGKGYALLLIQMGIVTPETTGFFTIIGMSIFFISVVRAPISGLMLVLEMTGQYHVFFPMIIAGTLTFFFGQYLNISPVYHRLYQLMLIDEHLQNNSMTTADFEVNHDSILIGRKVGEIDLPAESRIVSLKRDEVTPVDLTPEVVFKEGDLIKFEFLDQNYEKLFKVFRTLTNE